jgi:hypothetical protein
MLLTRLKFCGRPLKRPPQLGLTEQPLKKQPMFDER